MRGGREARLEEVRRRWRTHGRGTFQTVELTLNPLRQGAMMMSGGGRAGREGRGGEGGAEVRYQQIGSGASCDERRGALTHFSRLINFNQSGSRARRRKVSELKPNLSLSIRLMWSVNDQSGPDELNKEPSQKLQSWISSTGQSIKTTAK